MKEKVKNVPKAAKLFIFGSLIKDKVFSLITLIAMSLKFGIEKLTGLSFIKPVIHEITDEELENIKETFEKLQNEYLNEGGLEPIKINDEWLDEEIIYPDLSELKNDLTDIFILNGTYIEKQFEISKQLPEPPKPSEDDLKDSELIDDLLQNEPKQILNMVDILEEEPLDDHEKTFNEIYEMFETKDYSSKENLEEETPDLSDINTMDKDVINEPEVDTMNENQKEPIEDIQPSYKTEL